jgi:glutathione peroxidase
MLKTLTMFLTRPAQLDEPTDVYAHRVRLLDGSELDLETFRGRPALIVNTASKCGLTPQYEGLQRLHETYGPRGLQVLGCPSGDFAGQEYDEAEEIGAFCERNYGVTFPLTEKLSVRADPHPLWRDLIRQPGSAAPAWNFSKYLVGADGRLVARWSAKVPPEDADVTARIEAALPDGAGPGA